MLRPSSPGIMMSRMIKSMRAALIVCVIAAAVLRNGYAKSVAGQKARKKAAQFLVVVDDQDVL